MTRYEVQLHGGAPGEWATAADDLDRRSRSFTLEGLQNNRSYRVRVRAANPWGVGPWAEARDPLVPVAPVPVGDEETPVPDAGEVVTSRNGQREAVVVEVVEGNTVQIRSEGSDDFRLRVASLERGGRPVPVSQVDRSVEVDEGGSVVAGGDGFEAGSAASVYLFSEPTFLGTVPVGPDGSFEGALPLPAGVGVGRHTLQVNGVDRGGESRSVSLGIRVSPETPQREGDDVPEVPTNLQATALEDGALVSWDPPASPDTAPLTGYVIEMWNLETSEVTRFEVDAEAAPPFRAEDLGAGEPDSGRGRRNHRFPRTPG